MKRIITEAMAVMLACAVGQDRAVAQDVTTATTVAIPDVANVAESISARLTAFAERCADIGGAQKTLELEGGVTIDLKCRRSNTTVTREMQGYAYQIRPRIEDSDCVCPGRGIAGTQPAGIPSTTPSPTSPYEIPEAYRRIFEQTPSIYFEEAPESPVIKNLDATSHPGMKSYEFQLYPPYNERDG